MIWRRISGDMPVKEPSSPTLDDRVVPTVPTRIVFVRRIRFHVLSPEASWPNAEPLTAISAATEPQPNSVLRLMSLTSTRSPEADAVVPCIAVSL